MNASAEDFEVMETIRGIVQRNELQGISTV